jgi:hypothetical protein
MSLTSYRAAPPRVTMDAVRISIVGDIGRARHAVQSPLELLVTGIAGVAGSVSPVRNSSRVGPKNTKAARGSFQNCSTRQTCALRAFGPWPDRAAAARQAAIDPLRKDPQFAT